MAFMIHSVDGGYIPSLEYLPAEGVTPEVGMALSLSAGNLALCSGAARPGYISMCQRESACAAGELIPVVRAGENIVFETTFSASASAVKLGTLVTLAADGLRVTATSGGPAEVVYMAGTASGSVARVRFPIQSASSGT